ncbi:glycoside hydrolase family 32 protein [Haloferula sp. A504]|uniref:glycoside hydrolase family 32 protein n=1 Tax=Haloferula sp. A504 TaxID=3373601 RepID=UPI0031BCD0E2|nr:glycoside hydrolase family 32 protein [Verrucomicrobiaceae bacterium E54]
MNMHISIILPLVASMAIAAPEAQLLFDNSDFEKGTLENWTAEGDAFANQPTKGDNPAKRGRPDGSKHQGDFWIGTFEDYNGTSGQPGQNQGDEPTGRLTSVGFEIEQPYLNFLVGGGPNERTSVRLRVGDKTYLLSPGFASETMQPISADVGEFKGKTARIILLDDETGGWGHINADHFTASAEPLAKVVEPRETKPAILDKRRQVAEFTIDKKYIVYPIENGDGNQSVSLRVDDEVVRFYKTNLASTADDIDWWAFEDVSEFKGRRLTLTVSRHSDEGFKLIRQSDTVPGADQWGEEPLRPQFHFSQKVGWNNDPNGMVYHDGEWHLYFQHNPVGWGWGNMTWGHAVSKDLVNWTQLPNALHHREGDAMFSGGAAVDWKNTGGWKTGDNDVIVATWTSTGRGECIAWSNDKGRTFIEYEGNPVLRHGGRDPKPVWYEYAEGEPPLSAAAAKLGGHWVIAVYDEDKELGRNIAFYSSTDFKNWELQSKLPGYFECPELFSLPVAGDPSEVRWVVFGADAKYAIGTFDGRTFTPEHEGRHQLHYGPYYASQIFSDAPDGRRIQIGWARIEMKGMPFNQTFTFPTELSLRRTPDGVRLFGEPVKAIEKIHGRKHETADKPLAEGRPVKLETSGDLFDIRATFEVGTAKRLGLIIDGRQAFAYDAANKKLNNAELEPVDGRISVQILIDRPMMETFVNHGRMIITAPYQNDLDITSVEAFAEGGEARLLSLEIHELNASWK